MNMKIPIVALALWLFAHVALAQQEKILIPITPAPAFGAHGSIWENDLVITNMGDTPVTVFGYSPINCPVEPCSTIPQPIPPRTTIFTGSGSEGCGVEGLLLTTDPSSAEKLAFTLRSRDRSRDERSWGAVVPVVRSSAWFSTPFSIVDVPLTSRFRATLRIYDGDPTTTPAVRVRYFAVHPTAQGAPADTFLSETTPSFALPPESSRNRCPGYSQIALSLDPSIVSAGRIRITVEPLDGRREYWAFVSVTNNDTQEVTIIAPQ